MAQQVNIKIKINDNLKDVSIDAESLGKAIDQVIGKTENLNTTIVRLGSVSQIAEAAASAFGQLNAVFGDLTDAYAAQSVAESRLEQAMSNTMGATDEEVRSIKDLCSAQQQLGVIGDEVQLAATQELATYLEYSDSLKAIIPVMNDMAAQQYGLGASAESVTQIATMLGKVMNGQTEALSRYGYKFDEAQKQILQFGTEAERAAVLVDVVSESVGGMNAALAQTPAGRMQQISNTIGDWKERIGQTVQSMMPLVTTFNQVAQSITTITKLTTAFKALANSELFAKVQTLALSAAKKTQAAVTNALTTAERTASVATKALAVDAAALQAALTMGLSVAITAIVAVIAKLVSKSKEASDSLETVDEAAEAFTQTSKDARSELALYQVKLQDIIRHHKNDAQTVEELNQKYGKSFGYYNDAATWYDVLTQKSAAYCRQLGYEAQAKVIAAQLAEKEMEQRKIGEKLQQMRKDGKGSQSRHFGLVHDVDGNIAGWGTEYRYDNAEYAELLRQGQDLDKDINDLKRDFKSCADEASAAQKELEGAVKGTDAALGWQEMSLAQLTKAIQDQKGVVESLAGVDEKQAKVENSLLKQMESRKKLLESTYLLGSKSGGDKDKYDGSKLIENASSYKELGNNIKFYQEALEKTAPTETAALAALHEKIKALKSAQTAITLLSGETEKTLDVKIKPDYGQSIQEFENALKDIKDSIAQEMDSIIGPMGTGLDMEMELTLATKVQGAEIARQQIETLQKMLSVAKGEQKKAVQDAIQDWSRYAVTQADATTKGEAAATSLDTISSVMGQLGGVVKGAAGDWLSWAGRVLSSIAQVIPQMVSLATANTAVAATGAAASVANIPIVGWVKAGAVALGLAATLASIPKFADGALAYGPTLGIIGEYAGASGNPEVIAPLDKLKGLMGADGGVEKVEFSIRGDRLVAIIDKRIRMMMRNG